MKFKGILYKYIIPAVVKPIITIYSHCLRLTVTGLQEVEKIKKTGKPIIFAVLHGRQFMVYRCFSHKKIGAMSSTSRDGRLQADILKKFGFQIAWGSSGKSPVRALIGLIKIMNAGYDGIMAVDGPKGPIYEVKPGILFLAKKLDAVIIPYIFSAEKAIIMKAWDKYMLPKPFTKVLVEYGEPFEPSKDTSKGTLESERIELENILLNIMNEADKKCGRK